MSFLYKALIKEQQNTNNELAQAQTSFPLRQSFAVNNSSPNALWITIGVLLLLVGLLAGYLLATHVTLSNIDTKSLLTRPTINSIYGNKNQTNNEASTPDQIPQSDLNVLSIQDDQTELATTEKLTSQNNEIDINAANIEQDSVSLESEQDMMELTVPSGDTSSDYTDELADVPEELKTVFANAVSATEQSNNDNGSMVESGSSLPTIEQLDLLYQQQIPPLYYQMHIFASLPSERWLKINNTTLYEGEFLTEHLVLEEVRQYESIWSIQGKRFTLTALTDYSMNTQ